VNYRFAIGLGFVSASAFGPNITFADESSSALQAVQLAPWWIALRLELSSFHGLVRNPDPRC
jgi:hypothetical protein